jgi:hypothetical protein
VLSTFYSTPPINGGRFLSFTGPKLPRMNKVFVAQVVDKEQVGSGERTEKITQRGAS